MAQVTGPEFGVPFVLTGPDGSRAVFNDQTDPDYVGMLTEISGLDSPEVRESADDLVEADGGVHGSFYYGRRPVVLTGLFLNPASATDRNERMTKLRQASNALRGDAILSWTPSGGSSQEIRVRRQQPLRMEGGWQKTFNCSLVAADPRIYSTLEHTDQVNAVNSSEDAGRAYDLGYDIDYGPASPNGQLLVTNNGSAETPAELTVTGPGTNPTISNLTNGGSIRVVLTLDSGTSLVINTLNRTVLEGGTVNRYGSVDFDNTQWFGLEPGENDLRLAFDSFSSGASLSVDWKDAWL